MMVAALQSRIGPGAEALSSPFSPTVIAIAVLFMTVLPSVIFLRRLSTPHRDFLVRIFLLALTLRVGTVVAFQIFGLQSIVAGDAEFYDSIGREIARSWQWGTPTGATRYLDPGWSGWGMTYFVSTLYYVFGPSLLAVQFLASLVGSLVAVVIFFIAERVSGDARVSRLASILVAVLPALVLWSSQGVKDPFIIFCLALSVWAMLRVYERLSPGTLILLLATLLVLFAFRAYVFYIFLVAMGASLVLNLVSRPGKTGRALVAVLFVAMVLVAVVGGIGAEQVEQLTDLQDIASRREWAARVSASGFAPEANVSTPAGALAFLPLGLVYVLLGPFPWQMLNLQQIATLPDMVIWWVLFPFLVMGVVRAVRHRLASASLMLLFSALLASAYGIASGNLGTVYRQRTQFVVFLLVFVAMGLVHWRDRRGGRRRPKKRPNRFQYRSGAPSR